MPTIAIEDLRQLIGACEQGYKCADHVGFTTGCAEFDALLPDQAFATGALHELKEASYRDRAASLGVALALCARLVQQKSGPVVWCQLRSSDRLHLHAPGLSGFGIDPARIVKLMLKSEQEMLWAIEEALDCAYVAAVIGVLGPERFYDFKASRRLSLRAKKSGVTAIIVRGHRASGVTAADTRWHVSSLASLSTQRHRAFLPGLSKAAWRLEMVKCKGAKPGTIITVWDHETLCFDLAARLANGAALPPQRSAGKLQHAG